MRLTVAIEACAYLALTLIITWPLAAHPTTSLPGDYGDPLFISAVMGWVMKQLTAMLTGHGEAITNFWNLPIFYPERNALALSDHFTAQAVQALPVWWATGNLILSYTFIMVSSFVLVALGTSLLVSDLTGSRAAGIVAGIMAAFNPYRLLLEISHLQMLSLQWFPIALLGFHRYVAARRESGVGSRESGSVGWLAVGSVSALALNLSSGYYMLYAGPFIALFVLLDVAFHGRLRDRGVWLGLVVSAICIALITTPFVIPYVNMQKQQAFERTLREVIMYSATLDQYVAGLPWLAPMLICAAGAAIAWRREHRLERRYAVVFLVFSVLAFWLSLGPVIRSGGQELGVPSAYQLLYDWVPGFRGARVASRYAAILLICLPVLAGMGLASFTRLVPRLGTATMALVGLLYLSLIWPSRFPINDQLPSANLQPPPEYLTPSPHVPSIYATVAGLDPNVVVAELPFGDLWYDLRYMYFATMHGRRLMNGYSGVFPASYLARKDRLSDPLASPTRAAEALAGATHVIVHERAWTDDNGQRIEAWLESLGGVVVAEADGARLIALESLRREALAALPR